MATATLIPGLPPQFQDNFDHMTPEDRSAVILRLAQVEQQERRKHTRMRKSLLKSDGIDIGPYPSLYEVLWNEYRRVLAQHAQEYVMLGLTSDADLVTKREVKNAYRRQARKLHPDVGGDADAFKHLYAAYRAVLAIAQD